MNESDIPDNIKKFLYTLKVSLRPEEYEIAEKEVYRYILVNNAMTKRDCDFFVDGYILGLKLADTMVVSAIKERTG